MKTEFHKLVRDKVLSRMLADGMLVRSFQQAEEDLPGEVAEKILEEAAEVRRSAWALIKDQRNTAVRQAFVSELADLEDWLYFLQCLFQVSTLEVQAAQAQKTETHGRPGRTYIVDAEARHDF